MDNSKKIDFLACERHNFSHLKPIWDSLTVEHRGVFHILTQLDRKEEFIGLNELENLSIFDSPKELTESLNIGKDLLVTSTFYDQFLSEISRPMVFVAHGGGQTFKEQPLHLFARKNYVLDIVPNEHMAQVFQQRYPYTQKHVVGSPKLDKWHIDFKKPENKNPVIAISFHFDRQTVPETRTSWPHFKNILPLLARQKKWKTLGHGHPRMIDTLIPHYEKLSIEIVKDFDEVMQRADLYICDHMATLYEFASTNRPVVVLNAPWYRREMEHGLRFWEHADVGINCDHPKSLFEAIELALADPPEQQAKRRKAVNAVYPFTDGHSSQRSAKALTDFAIAWQTAPCFLYPGTSEKQIFDFLRNNDISEEELVDRCELHKSEILKALANINADKPLHVNDLEFHFWALALSLQKLGKSDEAKCICTEFYSSFGGSVILSTVFRCVLLSPMYFRPSSKTDPLVSVVIPLYNQGGYLKEAVSSVLNQSYPNWELIIVNDGSTDDSLEIAKQIQQDHHERPIKILDQKNKGKGFTRNRGIRKSSGKYVCVLDADDMLATGYLLEAVDLLEKNQNTGWITPVTLQFGRVHQIFYHFDFDFRELMTICPSPVTSVFRRELWTEIGGFDENMTDREDWEFWIKAAEAGWTSQHTKYPQFLYRIQEKRFGERSDVNINSKLEIIQRHPWWFKVYPRDRMVDFCSQFSTCNFAPEILRQENIARASSAPRVKGIRRKVIDDIKKAFAESPEMTQIQGVNSQTESYLRMAKYFADKGNRKQAEKYIALAGRVGSESDAGMKK